MKRKQLNFSSRNASGFTLIEIAIVLVIIGLLLGGVLKGQELINSAKVKNLATDFKNIPVFVYGYQDKFKALPGDDKNVVTLHLAGMTPAAVLATTPASSSGNGRLDGEWDSITETDESILFWQHVRLAGLAPGPTAAPAAGATAIEAFVPANAVGGRIGISSTLPITGMTGSYYVCSYGIDGKFVTQLDTTLDDGVTTTGSVRAMANRTGGSTTAGTAVAVVAGTTYTVCMAI